MSFHIHFKLLQNQPFTNFFSLKLNIIKLNCNATKQLHIFNIYFVLADKIFIFVEGNQNILSGTQLPKIEFPSKSSGEDGHSNHLLLFLYISTKLRLDYKSVWQRSRVVFSLSQNTKIICADVVK